MKTRYLSVIPLCLLSASASAGIRSHMPDNLALDLDGGFYQSAEGLTAYSGYADESSSRANGNSRNVKQNHKFSWGAGLTTKIDDGVLLRSSIFLNDHRNRDHRGGATGLQDAVTTLRLPVEFSWNASARAHSMTHINHRAWDLTLSKPMSSGVINFTPTVGIERSKIHYSQITTYEDLDQGNAYVEYSINEKSEMTGAGVTFGADVDHPFYKNWKITAGAAFALLPGQVRTAYSTSNNEDSENYDQKSLDKHEVIQHLKGRFGFSKDISLWRSPVKLEVGYKYDLYPGAIKLLKFPDGSPETFSVNQRKDYAFSGVFFKVGMDLY